MTFPTPTGAAPTGAGSFVSLNDQSESYYQAIFTQHWGAAAGKAYAAYNAANPSNTPYTNAKLFEASVFAQGLAKAIAQAGGVVAQVPGAAAKGAANAVSTLTSPLSGIAAIGDFFQRLTQASTWIRAAEVLLGLGLIIVGLAELAKGTSVGRAAAKAGKAAALL